MKYTGCFVGKILSDYSPPGRIYAYKDKEGPVYRPFLSTCPWPCICTTSDSLDEVVKSVVITRSGSRSRGVNLNAYKEIPRPSRATGLVTQYSHVGTEPFSTHSRCQDLSPPGVGAQVLTSGL